MKESQRIREKFDPRLWVSALAVLTQTSSNGLNPPTPIIPKSMLMAWIGVLTSQVTEPGFSFRKDSAKSKNL